MKRWWALALLPVLAACGHHANGQITTKQYEPGYTMWITSRCGKSTCQMPQWIPDSYVFYVDHKRCEVDSGTYSQHNKGDHYDGSCA